MTPSPLCRNAHSFIESFWDSAWSGWAVRKWPPWKLSGSDWAVKTAPVGEFQLVGGLAEQLCSTAGQFSLVLQPGHKSFYFPQARASVLYTAHHLIKESKVTGLVKVMLPLHVQQCLINTVASRLLVYAANCALFFLNLQSKQTLDVLISLTMNCSFGCGSNWFIFLIGYFYM